MRIGFGSLLGRRSTHHGIPAVVRVAVLLSLLAGPAARHAEAQGVPAGTVIRSWAVASFVLNSQTFTLISDTTDIVVAQVAGADLEPPRVTSGAIGTNVLLQQVLTNAGNGTDSFTVVGTSASGWSVTIYRDLNGDGQINGADAPISGPVSLGYAGQAALIAQVAVPNDVALLGLSDTVRVTAASLFDAATSDSLVHRINIVTAPLTVAMTKMVDRVTALPGDVITYTLSYDALGVGLTSAFQIQDTVPTGTAYLPGTLRWNGSPLSDAAGDDAGMIAPVGNGIVMVELGSVSAGTSGTMTFQVRANSGPPRTVSNRASAIYASSGVTDTVLTNDAVTSVLASELSLAKDLVSPAAASVGEAVRYTFRYSNLSGTSTVPGVILVDTLPAGLDYVGATPAPTVAGPVLSWSLGSLAPGQIGTIDLVTRVNSAVRDTNWVRNSASLASSIPGASALPASAAQVALVGPASSAIALDLTADVLQVALGDVIPFTAVVRNTGVSAVSQTVLAVTMPQSGRYARRSVTGADSARVVGNQLLVYTAATLAPGGTRTLHLGVALTSASSTVVQTRAIATAQTATATATSAEAIATVQVRRAWPVETRAAIGKVWVDTNGDGAQSAGDVGLAGIEVWTEDGEVATTDATGKFSFTNLRPGRHSFRVDPRSLAGDYRVAGDDIRTVESTGWTTPRVDFRVIPVGARLADTWQPVDIESAAGPTPITVQVTTAPVLAAAAETVTVSRARTAESRSTERRASLVQGPGIEFVAPTDGTVLPSDRVYVGVKGEPGATVMLYDGDNVIDSAAVRVDGLHDFIAVPLARGPHVLRVRMANSWGHERWDSLAVHVTGLPARFEAPARVALAADGRTVTTESIRVLDSWGVPVVQPAYVTVTAQGAEPIGEDADRSSVGSQLLSTGTGRLEVPLRAGRTVGAGLLMLKSGDAEATIPLEINPEIRPLTVTGAGLVGVGASPEAYGAITARGRLDARTSVTLSLDSRNLDAGQDAFGRDQDPLEDAQYPILGDASHVVTRAASATWFSARLERGLDWMSFGDVATNDFAAGLSLAGYRRAVSGVAGRITTGPVTWSGFGSMTTQSLRQLQIRGAGVSGPYELGPDVLPGTEQLRLETRALENPERAVVTQGLTRFVDYQIDYTSGVVLFTQPVPATDGQGNPVYVIATFEAASGGERQLVAGGRAALDLNRALRARGMDSLRLGVTAVSAEQTVAPFRLVGADVRALRLGGLDLGAEVAYAEQGDSAGFATAAKAGYGTAEGPVAVGASYMSVGREFSNPSNVALRPGTTEIALRGAFKVGSSILRASHSWQQFQLDGVTRQSTRVGVVRSFGRRLELDAGVAHRREESGVAGSIAGEAQSGELKITAKPTEALQLWAEGRRQFTHSGTLAQPDFWGIGSAYRLSPAVALEGSQRFVTPSTGANYSVSSVGVRADVGYGTQAWGSYQLSGGTDGGRSAALLGLNNRVRLAPGLGMNLMFERRVGLDQAAISDPVRAAPFLQPEEDYWAAGLGIELTPEQAPYRLTARGEYKDGIFQSNRLLTLAGDVTFNSSLALLSRQEFTQTARPDVALARRLASLWGLALRPTGTDRLNVLAKFQWSDERNPIGGGVLVSQGNERKLIGAADVIWTPVRGAELGTRYAIRRTDAVRQDGSGLNQSLSSRADYAGAHMSVDITRWLAFRGDGRLLIERTSATERWDAAPSIALRLINGLEIAGGYRFGDLRDPDFSVRGGRGLFVTMSASITERQFPTAAEFWRSRF